MSKSEEMFVLKNELVSLSNKSLPVLVDRLTIFLTTRNPQKARNEIKEIRKSLTDIEVLLAEIEKRERNGNNG